MTFSTNNIKLESLTKKRSEKIYTTVIEGFEKSKPKSIQGNCKYLTLNTFFLMST